MIEMNASTVVAFTLTYDQVIQFQWHNNGVGRLAKSRRPPNAGTPEFRAIF